jgi:invasion protein IalB
MRSADPAQSWRRGARAAILAALGLPLLAGAVEAASLPGQEEWLGLRGRTESDLDRPEATPAAEPDYRIKPPEIALSEGAARGSVRRLIQPFGPWTLICDEDLRRREKICNVSQSILDRAGRAVFNWSLAATRMGAPAFILRAPRAGPGRPDLAVRFAASDPQPVELARCDAHQCLGFLAVTPALRGAIRAGAAIEIIYRSGQDADPVRFATTLDGLASALASIR